MRPGVGRGFLGICDATQQIYLNLPSWEVEWQEAWERRRRRTNQRLSGSGEVLTNPT